MNETSSDNIDNNECRNGIKYTRMSISMNDDNDVGVVDAVKTHLSRDCESLTFPN